MFVRSHYKCVFCFLFSFGGQHRTELLQIFSVERLPALTVMSRVIVLHALQILKLRANPRAEYWVRNIFLNSHGDDLSEIKTLTDAKGDYYCMSKLIYDDIKSETVRQDILNHIRKEGAMQLSRRQLGTIQRGPNRRYNVAWRKILSDVDDTLLCSGGLYPAGIDKRYPRKVVYPGVLAFYRELDLGTTGPDDWPEHKVGNLVFLSARPHVYKDMSEKGNFAKFEKLRAVGDDGRRGMHTVPSLLAGDLASGSQYIATNDFEPLALKKFDNFKRYVSIYPEYSHIFVCDNGQGDVNAGEMMHDNFPYEFQAVYVHLVQDIHRTYGFAPERWEEKEFRPCFFTTYPEAALHAAIQNPPLIRVNGLQRVCFDAVKDFQAIPGKKWQSNRQMADRRAELNQAIWRVNKFLIANKVEAVALIQAERIWKDGEKVKTPYGNGFIRGFDPEFDMYQVELDWRPLDIQVSEHILSVKEEVIRPKHTPVLEKRASVPLETVVEADEITDDEQDDIAKLGALERPALRSQKSLPVTLPSSPRTGYLENNPSSFPSTEHCETKKNQSIHDNKNATSSMSDSSSISSISSDDSNQLQKSNSSDRSIMRVTAAINGRSISKFIPPSLPKMNKKSSPLFSFWISTLQPKLSEGEKCTTPYGHATVVEHRIEHKIVVVDMATWKARAYLNEKDVKVVKEGLLAALFRRQASVTEPVPKFQHFPYVKGTIIRTPFGEAEVVVPLPPPEDDHSSNPRDNSNDIICLSLNSWTLANDSHPKLYCTVKTCQMWKDAMAAKVSSDGLFSAFGTFVSSINREINARLSNTKHKEEEQPAPKFNQYYQISAAVSTDFGNGRIVGFRASDGFYNVSLSNWTLANGKHPIAWLRGVDIRCRLAKGCQEGYPVLTNLGVTGILESVQTATGIHIVTAPSARMVLYLQPDAIVRPLKAAVGEDVLTAYGEGSVDRYDIANDTYVIKLKWGAVTYAKAETFDRLRDSMSDKDGSFGMDWLLRFFFSAPGTKKDGGRSRSNSLVSSKSVRS
jgi:hypothetical protein